MRENELDVANKSKYINGVSRTFNTRSYLNLQPRKKGCETQRKREAGVSWGERWGSTHLFTAWQLWILQNAKMSCKFARVCNMRALFIWQLQLPVTVLQALPLVTAPGFRVFSASLSLFLLGLPKRAVHPVSSCRITVTVNVAIHIKIIVCRRTFITRNGSRGNPGNKTPSLPTSARFDCQQMILKMQFGQKCARLAQIPWLKHRYCNSFSSLLLLLFHIFCHSTVTHLAIRICKLHFHLAAQCPCVLHNLSCNTASSQCIKLNAARSSNKH